MAEHADISEDQPRCICWCGPGYRRLDRACPVHGDEADARRRVNAAAVRGPMAADVPCESRPRRDPVDSIAYALCANDESGDPDYGNDAVARMVHDQLVSDGHLRTPIEVDHADPATRAAERLPVDWFAVATALYEAIGELDDAMPGGIGLNVAPSKTPTLQRAIDAYEYATDVSSTSPSGA